MISQMGSRISDSCLGIKRVAKASLVQKIQRDVLPASGREVSERHGAASACVGRKNLGREIFWNGYLKGHISWRMRRRVWV